MAAASLYNDVTFFLIPKNVTCEKANCADADVDTLVGGLEGIRGGEMAEKYRVDWDASDGRNGGAQRTVWGILLEMERYKNQAGGKDQVLDLAKTSERVSLPVVWAWATHFSFPRKILRVLCGYFEHQRRVQFEGCVAEPLRTITAILPGSKWSCLLLRIVLQDAFSEETKRTLR